MAELSRMEKKEEDKMIESLEKKTSFTFDEISAFLRLYREHTKLCTGQYKTLEPLIPIQMHVLKLLKGNFFGPLFSCLILETNS